MISKFFWCCWEASWCNIFVLWLCHQFAQIHCTIENLYLQANVSVSEMLVMSSLVTFTSSKKLLSTQYTIAIGIHSYVPRTYLASSLSNKNYNNATTTSYRAMWALMNALRSHLFSSVQRRNYAVVFFIMLATGDVNAIKNVFLAAGRIVSNCILSNFKSGDQWPVFNH